MSAFQRERDLFFPLGLAFFCVLLMVAGVRYEKLPHAMAWTAWVLEPFERPAAFLSEKFGEMTHWFVDRQILLDKIQKLQLKQDSLVLSYGAALQGELSNQAAQAKSYIVDFRDPRAWWDDVRLDLRKGQIVQRGTPVLKDGVLVGLVSQSIGHSCWVRLVTSENSYLPVVVDATRDLGVLVGDGHGKLWLRYTPPLDLPTGSVIVSAMGGDLIPPGLPVGTLSGEKRESEPGQVEYGVISSTELTRLHTLSLPEGVSK